MGQEMNIYIGNNNGKRTIWMTRLEEYEINIYDKTEKVFLKWREGVDGARELKKERQENTKTEYCRVCKNLQHKVRLWTRQIEIKCFHKEKQQWGRDRITAMSIKTLIGIAWVQMPHKITYTEKETSPQGAAGLTGDIREKLPVPFMRHVMQQTINLEQEHGPDMRHSEYKIRHSRYRVDGSS